jgi:hypothetical protein
MEEFTVTPVESNNTQVGGCYIKNESTTATEINTINVPDVPQIIDTPEEEVIDNRQEIDFTQKVTLNQYAGASNYQLGARVIAEDGTRYIIGKHGELIRTTEKTSKKSRKRWLNNLKKEAKHILLTSNKSQILEKLKQANGGELPDE